MTKADEELTKEIGGQRRYRGAAEKALSAYCILVAVYHIIYVSGLLPRMGIFMPSILHRAISLTSFGVLVFVFYPAHKHAPTDRMPWYDVLLAALTLVGVGFAAYGYNHLLDVRLIGYVDTITMIMAWIAMLVIFEGTRRLLGLAMPLIALLFILQTMLSNYLPGIFTGRGYGFDRIALDLFVVDGGIFGFAMDVASTVVVMFIIFSQFLGSTAAGEFIINSALALFGHVRGGPAKAAVVASAAFGTISGSTLANIAAVGTMTIPLMKKAGYKPHVAAAIESVASNGGQIMPPVMGIVAFLIAQWLEMPYYQVCVAAALPAILYFLAVFVMVDLEAAKTGLRGLPREQLPSFRKALKEGWYFTLPIIALVLFVGVLRVDPEKAALYSLIIIVILGSFLGKQERRLQPMGILKALESGTKGSIQVIMACATAGTIIGCIGITNVGVRLSAILIDIAGGNMLLLLVLTAIVAYIMGMGTSSVAIYVTLVLLVAPALIKMGVLPIGAHLFVFYWGLTALITPPVALAAYAAGAIAGASPFKTGFTAMRFSIVLYVLPFIWIFFPSLLFQGTPSSIFLAVITSVIATSAISISLAGYLIKPATWLERILIAGGGFGLLIGNMYIQIGGIIVLSLALMMHFVRIMKNSPEKIKLEDST